MKTHYSENGLEYCSKYISRSASGIKSKASQLDLILSPSTLLEIKAKSVLRNPDDYNVNPNIFINVTTPEAAYILGLLWADGDIEYNSYRAVVKLASTYPDAKTFGSIFKKTGKWGVYRYPKLKENWKDRCQIKTYNRTLATFLFENDYASKDKSADKILSKIPVYLKHYWFRGLLDGDGCIHISKQNRCRFSISGPYEQSWKYIEWLFKQFDIKYTISRIINKDGSKSYIQVDSKRQGKIILDYIYNGYKIDKIGLRRKYKKYLKLIEIIHKYDTFKGVYLFKNIWRAYSSTYNKNKKVIMIGYFKKKPDAINAVKSYYNSNLWPIPYTRILEKQRNEL